jgi:beta-glucosidase
MYFNGEPLYPFGYGLSYTTFQYSNLKTSSNPVASDGTVLVSVDVTNTGNQTGDEVVQIYAKHLGSKVDRPGQQLAGFRRVTIKPNEKRTVQIPVKASTLAYWDDKSGQFKVEAEPVSLMVGSSSADIKLSTTVQVR